MGIGEALVTALNEKGIPTPLAATMMRAPMSRMDVLTTSEIDAAIAKSKLARKYNEVIDRESAYEILGKKMEEAQAVAEQTLVKEQEQKAAKKTTSSKSSNTSATDTVTKGVVKVLTSAAFIRGAMGVLSKMFKSK